MIKRILPFVYLPAIFCLGLLGTLAVGMAPLDGFFFVIFLIALSGLGYTAYRIINEEDF